MTFPRQIPADTIITFLDTCRRNLWETWRREKQITSYANGGPPPSDDDTAESEIVPLGFAQKRMKDEMAPLLDPLYLEPGIIDGEYFVPADTRSPERTTYVQRNVVKEINAVVWQRLIPVLRPLAGRATITGRGFLYWKSPNDWLPVNGQMIYPVDAGDDVLDSTFREWGFMAKLSLRDIDQILKSNLKPDRMGWSRKGLEMLKLWIMASEAQKYINAKSQSPWGAYDPEMWLSVDLSNSRFRDPVDVYWYFRKNGKITKNDPRYGGHEQVDVYCISRFGSQSSVRNEMRDAYTRVVGLTVSQENGSEWRKMDEEYRKRMNISDPEEQKEMICNERLLFYSEGLFRSVEECLIPHIDDFRVSGDQRMSEVCGAGRTMMPKLAVLEQLMTDLVQGISFGVTPNYNIRPGVSSEYLDQLQRSGSRSGQAFPDGVTLVAKNNSFTGVGQAGQFIQMLDTSIASDSASASQGTFGGSSADFASQAAAQLQGQQATLSRRLQIWLVTLDKVADRVASVLCRAWPQIKKSWPSYEDSNRMGMCLQTYYGIHPDEWDSDRWKWKARRLAGGMTRQQSLAVNLQMLQTLGAVFPSLVPFFGKEMLRSVYGDSLADQMTETPQQDTQNQEYRARLNVSIAYANGTPPPVMPMDSPMVHSGIAGQVATNHIQAAVQAGQTTPQEVVGVTAILTYAAAHIMRLPEQLSKPGLQRVQELIKTIQSIPTPSAQDQQMTEKDRATLMLKQRGQERLERTDQDKRDQNMFDRNVTMAKLADSRDALEQNALNSATSRAKSQMDMSLALDEADNAYLSDPLAAN